MSLEEPLAVLIDTMIDLIRLMEEESEALAISGPRAATDALAQAKIRLAAHMEAHCATLHRLNPDCGHCQQRGDRTPDRPLDRDAGGGGQGAGARHGSRRRDLLSPRRGEAKQFSPVCLCK